MKLYTCQMSQWRYAENFYDVTVKSGDKLLAPTWDLLRRSKEATKKGIDYREQYIPEFIALMRVSFMDNKDHWVSLLSHDVLTIACYCSCDDYCHRQTLVTILRSVAEFYNIPFEYMGELPKQIKSKGTK